MYRTRVFQAFKRFHKNISTLFRSTRSRKRCVCATLLTKTNFWKVWKVATGEPVKRLQRPRNTNYSALAGISETALIGSNSSLRRAYSSQMYPISHSSLPSPMLGGISFVFWLHDPLEVRSCGRPSGVHASPLPRTVWVMVFYDWPFNSVYQRLLAGLVPLKPRICFFLAFST